MDYIKPFQPHPSLIRPRETNLDYYQKISKENILDDFQKDDARLIKLIQYTTLNCDLVQSFIPENNCQKYIKDNICKQNYNALYDLTIINPKGRASATYALSIITKYIEDMKKNQRLKYIEDRKQVKKIYR